MIDYSLIIIIIILDIIIDIIFIYLFLYGWYIMNMYI